MHEISVYQTNILPTGEQLKNFRESISLTQAKLELLSGLTRRVISNMETGKTAINFEYTIKLNKAFNIFFSTHNQTENTDLFVKKFCPDIVNLISESLYDDNQKRLNQLYKQLSNTDRIKILERMEYIVSTYNDEESIPTKSIPLIGWTACGQPIEAIENTDEYIETNELKATFALTAKGDSMAPYINDGDILLIKETSEIEIGEIGIFQINSTGFHDDEEVTCKVLKSIKDGIVTLVPLNTAYDPILVDTRKDHVKIIGKYLTKQVVD